MDLTTLLKNRPRSKTRLKLKGSLTLVSINTTSFSLAVNTHCYWGLEIAINTSANGTNIFLLEAKRFGLVVTVMTSFFNVLN